MSVPTLILGLILSTLYGALFHLWRGGNAGRLLLYLVLAWVGFWLGQLLGNILHLSFDTLGQLTFTQFNFRKFYFTIYRSLAKFRPGRQESWLKKNPLTNVRGMQLLGGKLFC